MSTEPSEENIEESPSTSEIAIPDEGTRTAVTSMFASLTQVGGQFLNPIYGQVRPEHISSILGNSEAESVREAAAEASTSKFQAYYVTLGVIVLAVLVVYFSWKQQMEILLPIVTGVMGFGSGFGIGKFRSPRLLTRNLNPPTVSLH